ncbi:MAG: hypothetical protein ABGY13_07000 [Verrucomicrobiia bacterium]|jgi:hypothetical protein
MNTDFEQLETENLKLETDKKSGEENRTPRRCREALRPFSCAFKNKPVKTRESARRGRENEYLIPSIIPGPELVGAAGVGVAGFL